MLAIITRLFCFPDQRNRCCFKLIPHNLATIVEKTSVTQRSVYQCIMQQFHTSKKKKKAKNTKMKLQMACMYNISKEIKQYQCLYLCFFMQQSRTICSGFIWNPVNWSIQELHPSLCSLSSMFGKRKKTKNKEEPEAIILIQIL